MRSKKMLVLPIRRKWFDMIASGEKVEEYRECKPYWDVRLGNYFPFPMDGFRRWVVLRNGYGRGSPCLFAWCSLCAGFGREEWGAEKGVVYYILKIHEVRETKEWYHSKRRVGRG